MPFTPDHVRNPFPTYDRLRAVSPLVHDPATDLRLILDYATVKEVLTDHDRFSSHYGPADWLIFQDPPRHTRLRALIASAFTARSIANLAPRIQALADELLAPHLPAGRIDLATDFAGPLPTLVIAEMLGLPPADRPRFNRWNDTILAMSYSVGSTDARAQQRMADFIATTGEMGEYLSTLLTDRRTSPRDDLLTRLAQSEVDGQRLTPRDILGFLQLLLLAGSETTTNLIDNAILCFLDHPDQLARLRADPSLLPGAIEEVLRYRSPFQWMYRLTTRDLTLHNHPIPAGRLVLAIMGAANRDPAVFPDPGRFDITRSPNPHLAFGYGPHFCLGAPLARLESQIALTTLLTRLPDFSLATADPLPPRPGMHVLGPATLPLTFPPAQKMSPGASPAPGLPFFTTRFRSSKSEPFVTWPCPSTPSRGEP